MTESRKENTCPMCGKTAPQRAYDEKNAKGIAAADLTPDLFGAGVVLTSEEVLTLSLEDGKTYDAAGTVLIAKAGLALRGNGFTLAGLTVVGDVTLFGCTGVTLREVEIVGCETALTTDPASVALTLDGCRLSGKTALSLAASGATIRASVISACEAGIANTADGTGVYGCTFTGAGIRSCGEDLIVRQNSFCGEGTLGVLLCEGTQNALVAENLFHGEGVSITARNTRNSVLVLNQANVISVCDNRNLYVCENLLRDRLMAVRNTYFLADGNVYPGDEKDHSPLLSENTEENGDTLMDVNARLPYGADERLLPHVDRDQFVGMPRRHTVREENGATRTLDAYITECAKEGEKVIVPPGAYTVDAGMKFDTSHSNTTLYAYGVYYERAERLHNQMTFAATENFSIKGLTIAFRRQSCGQVYILKKLTGNRLLVVTGAGMVNEFGDTNPEYSNTRGMGSHRAKDFYAFADMHYESLRKLEGTDCGLPLMEMRVNDEFYRRLSAGDVLTCRMANGGTTISIERGCKNIRFIDFNIYGCAAGFAYVEHDALTATTYYRVADTTRSGELISAETYHAYRALGEKYGVNLEVSVDEEGRFRGSPARIGSIDATHTTRCGEGSKATSCLFENMCDDGTNQNATHGRIHRVTENGDGTTTIVYKGNLSQYSHQWGNRKPGGYCADFKVGDRVYVYTSGGQLVCDTPALSQTAEEGTIPVPEYGTETGTYSVKVKTEAVNLRALEGYNLDANGWESKDKVLIDNMSQASNNFVFDNCLVRNIRSRGLLIKASGGKILHCTFKNVGMACAAILYEIFWGESGVTEDMLVAHNIFDHTGYYNHGLAGVWQDRYAAISVEGLGSSVQEDYLLYKDIRIEDNIIKNRTTDYAVYINSAKNVSIKRNVFGAFIGHGGLSDPTSVPESRENPKPAIHLNGAMNVEISDNIYAWDNRPAHAYVVAEHIKNVYGSDVTADGNPAFPDME